jgi:hypothetical protein
MGGDGSWRSLNDVIDDARAEETSAMSPSRNGADPVQFTCPDCGKICMNSTGLASHRRSHSNGAAKPQPKPRPQGRTEATKAQEAEIVRIAPKPAPLVEGRLIARFYAPMMVELLSDLGDGMAIQVGADGSLEVFRAVVPT